MNPNFEKLLAELQLQTNITLLEEQLEDYSKSIVKECSNLIKAHAQNMDKYHFDDKAQTANSCAGIILEHFGVDKPTN